MFASPTDLYEEQPVAERRVLAPISSNVKSESSSVLKNPYAKRAEGTVSVSVRTTNVDVKPERKQEPKSMRHQLAQRSSSGVSRMQRARINMHNFFKVLVVGNAKCGKTSLVRRFTKGEFSDTYNTTIGADFVRKKLTCKDGTEVCLQLWDIAGQDRFARLTRAYFNKAKGAIVVCDVTREGTFEAAGEWKQELDRVFKDEGTDIPVFLVANKCDLIVNMEASFIAGAKMEKACQEHGFAGWFVTSAKDGLRIDEAMSCLVKKMRDAFPPPSASSSASHQPNADANKVRRRTPVAKHKGEKPITTPRGFKLINRSHYQGFQQTNAAGEPIGAQGCC